MRSLRNPGPAVALGVSVAIGAVLRVVHLSGTTFIWDETLDGVVARMPPDDMFRYLRHADVHPPLEYLLRAPIARHTTAEWPMRLPSAIASILALALLAWWLRHHGRLAVTTTALAALAGYQLFYAWEARPYAVMALAGVALAVLAHRWLSAPTTGVAIAAGALAAAAMLYHESGALLVPGLLLVAGRRADDAAWRWRFSILGGAAVWAAVWGTSFLDQLTASETLAGYVPTTSVDALVLTVKETVHYQPVLGLLTVLAVAAGGIALRALDRRLWAVWLCLFAVPLATLAIVGIRAHIVWSKTFAVASWGSLVAVAAGIEWVLRKRVAVGVIVLVATAVPVLATTSYVLRNPQFAYAPAWDTDIRRVSKAARPGDVVAGDDMMQFPARWYIGLDATSPPPAVVRRWPFAFQLAGAPWTGRVWVVAVGEPTVLVRCQVTERRADCSGR